MEFGQEQRSKTSRDDNPSDIDVVVEPAHPNLLRMERILKRNRVGQWLPLVVFAVSVFLTYQIARDADATAARAARLEFDFRAQESTRQISERMRSYEYILHGTAGLFAATGLPSRGQFRSYVEALRLETNHPGIQGIGFAMVIPPNGVAEHVEEVRRQGFADYAVRPSGDRPGVSSILYLEPFYGRNLRAFGFDMYSEPIRRAAMERARDTGSTAISAKVILVQENGVDLQPGFLMYLPVYQPGRPTGSLEERRANLAGWVFAPFRMRDLAGGLHSEQIAQLDVEVYDGKKVDRTTLMLDLFPGIGAGRPDQELSRTDLLSVGGHEWTVVSRALPDMHHRLSLNKSQTVIALGLGASLLLALLAWLFVDDRIYAMRAARQAMQLALYDSLTGLPNRKLINDLAGRAIERARSDATRMAMMFIDLDHFKPVNDTHGHAIGDLLLQEIANRLRRCVRRSDTVARLGGDEFVALLPHIQGRESAVAVAGKIQAALAQPFDIAGHSLRISASIGIAVFPEDGEDETMLLKHADMAMYRAKESGRNRIVGEDIRSEEAASVTPQGS